MTVITLAAWRRVCDLRIALQFQNWRRDILCDPDLEISSLFGVSRWIYSQSSYLAFECCSVPAVARAGLLQRGRQGLFLHVRVLHPPRHPAVATQGQERGRGKTKTRGVFLGTFPEYSSQLTGPWDSWPCDVGLPTLTAPCFFLSGLPAELAGLHASTLGKTAASSAVHYSCASVSLSLVFFVRQGVRPAHFHQPCGIDTFSLNTANLRAQCRRRLQDDTMPGMVRYNNWQLQANDVLEIFLC